MADDRAPLLVRPLHFWFGVWERAFPPLYRVLAVAVAAVLTTVLLVAITPVSWWLVLPLAVAAWIFLAVAQEHDERVRIPPDPVFMDRLMAEAGPVLAAAGFDEGQVSGRNRARGEMADVVLFQASPPDFSARFPRFDDDAESMDSCLWIERDASEGWMEASIAGTDLGDELRRLGYGDLADRVSRAITPEADADVLAQAFAIVLNPAPA